MAKRLGIIPSLFARPVFHHLTTRNHPLPDFVVTEDVPANLAIRLREKSLDAAFLSPIDYGRDYAMYSILPGICVAAGIRSMSAVVVFKQGLRKISTLAVSPSSSSEIVLANIIFAEQFDGTPTIVPFIGSVDDGLRKADAVLCTADDAFGTADRTAKLDLIEEWYTLTDFPFVHGFWVTRRDGLTPVEVETIVSMGKKGVENYHEDQKHKEYLGHFRYDFDDDVKSGLNEFLRMAYYYGILKDIPDVRYFSSEDDTVSSLP
jgi:predicted solute-binding protein